MRRVLMSSVVVAQEDEPIESVVDAHGAARRHPIRRNRCR
jgi:hypothetical protein